MIRFEWLHDPALVHATMTHPALWPWVSFDGVSPEAFVVPEGTAYAGAFDGDTYLGAFAFEPMGRHSAKAHIQLLPQARGRGVELGKAVIEWIRGQDPGLRLLVGETPAENRLALSCLRKIGFTTVGRLTDAVTQMGKVQDLVVSQFILKGGAV